MRDGPLNVRRFQSNLRSEPQRNCAFISYRERAVIGTIVAGRNTVRGDQVQTVAPLLECREYVRRLQRVQPGTPSRIALPDHMLIQTRLGRSNIRVQYVRTTQSRL